MEKIRKSEDEWRKELKPDQFRVMRQRGTEPPFTGEYWNSKARGTYLCGACNNELFSSQAKYDSGTGWPSFSEPLGDDRVETEEDRSRGVVRTEVHCSRCGSHLGHVFSDGPKPKGLRYCINSASLKFNKDESESA